MSANGGEPLTSNTASNSYGFPRHPACLLPWLIEMAYPARTRWLIRRDEMAHRHVTLYTASPMPADAGISDWICQMKLLSRKIHQV